MSATTTEETANRFSDAALTEAGRAFYSPSAPQDGAPSAAEAPASAPNAERDAAASGTGAPPADRAQPVAKEPTDAPAKTEAASPAPEARTTYPKWWKGTEQEWQSARAEQNKATMRERDARLKIEADHRSQAEELAFLKAQLLKRDADYEGILTQAYQDPRTAAEKLATSRQAGNESYLTEKQQRELAERERIDREAQSLTVSEAAQKARDLDALTRFGSEALPLQLEAARAGLDDLDVRGLLESAFDHADLADDVALTHALTGEAQERVVNRVYREAARLVRAQIAAAKAAKDEAGAPRADHSAGRQTVLGGTAGGGAGVAEMTHESVTAGINDHYQSHPIPQGRNGGPARPALSPGR